MVSIKTHNRKNPPLYFCHFFSKIIFFSKRTIKKITYLYMYFGNNWTTFWFLASFSYKSITVRQDLLPVADSPTTRFFFSCYAEGQFTIVWYSLRNILGKVMIFEAVFLIYSLSGCIVYRFHKVRHSSMNGVCFYNAINKIRNS